ncbi:MAG: N-acetyltransferase [Anaerolineales bacterium]|nr:N-acetyltransferase [Anaerolineales bacterium]
MSININMIIRPETSADYDAIRQVNILAFDNRSSEAGLVEAIRRQPDFIPALSLVAELDGQVVGHILFSPIRIETAQEHLPAISLAPMAVRPEYQNQGIGSALVEHGLAECRRLGQRIAIVLGHTNFYPRFGFMPASRWGLQGPYPEAGDAFMALELQPGALRGVQGTVCYPSIFDGV